MGVELGVFRKLVERNGNLATAIDLAAERKVGKRAPPRSDEPAMHCDILSTPRSPIMRVLTTIGYAGESGEREHVATALSKAMTAPYLETFAVHTSEHAGHAANRAPEYFELSGSKLTLVVTACSRATRWWFGLPFIHPFRRRRGRGSGVKRPRWEMS